MSAKRRLYFPKVVIHLGVAALLAVVLQIFAIFLPVGAGALRPIIFVLSYLLLIPFVAANLRRPGLVIIGVGLLLNLIPIVANGGLMPVTPESIHRLDQDYRIEGLHDGDAIPNSKNVLQDKDNTRLWFLTDRLVREWGPPVLRIISIGDVVIALGLLVTLGDLFLPRFGPAQADAPPVGDGA